MNFIKEDFIKEFQSVIDIALFDESPFDSNLAIKSINDFYSEFELDKPKHFFTYDNAKVLYENFNEWSGKVNGSVTSWEWNYPMVYPYSFWAHYVIKDSFDLTDKRKGPGLFVRAGEKCSSGENELPKSILRDMWEELADFEGLESYTKLLEKEVDTLCTLDVNEDFYNFLNGLLDVTSQENPFDVFFIGTDFKLVYEVAACNYFIKTHNVKRNDSYINAINNMLRNCGLVLGFDNVCVICKKINYS